MERPGLNTHDTLMKGLMVDKNSDVGFGDVGVWLRLSILRGVAITQGH